MQVNPGDYLECGEGETFSRVLVLSENKVFVKDGPATGDIMPLDEWYFMIGDARTGIRCTSYFEIPKTDTLYIDAPVPLIRVPSIRSQATLADPDIRTQTTLRTVELQPRKRTWNEWIFRMLLCGVND